MHPKEHSVATLIDHLAYTELKRANKHYEKELEKMGEDIWSERTKELWKKLIKDSKACVQYRPDGE